MVWHYFLFVFSHFNRLLICCGPLPHLVYLIVSTGGLMWSLHMCVCQMRNLYMFFMFLVSHLVYLTIVLNGSLGHCICPSVSHLCSVLFNFWLIWFLWLVWSVWLQYQISHGGHLVRMSVLCFFLYKSHLGLCWANLCIFILACNHRFICFHGNHVKSLSVVAPSNKWEHTNLSCCP